MERYKFRALKDDMSNCNFVYGNLVYDVIGQPRITAVDSSGQGLTFHTCIKGTEGQYVGITDIKGKEVFEGDRVNVIGIGLITIENEAGGIKYKSFFDMGHKCEIIGNIHEIRDK